MRNEKNEGLNSQKSNIFIRQPTSSIYSLLSQDFKDIEKIPINSNFLTFKDPIIEKKYIQGLFYSQSSMKSPSNEFKTNYFQFVLYYSLYFITTIVNIILRYISGSISVNIFLYKLVITGFFSIVIYMALYLLMKSKRIFRNSSTFLTILGVLIIVMLIITDDQSIFYISGKEIEYSSTTSLLLLSFIYIFKLLLFGNFRNILILSLTSMSLMILKSVFIKNRDIYIQTYETCMFCLIVSIICMTCYRYEHFSRDLFWKSESKIEKFENISEITEYNDSNPSHLINTEIELLILLCEKIKKTVKNVCSLIIYKDMKLKLKIVANDLETLKKRIASDIFRSSVRLENHDHIDDQDKAFISQVFMQVSLKSPKNLRKLITMKELPEKKNPFFSKKYGLQELDKVLESIGLNWNFDIWFIFQTTGHSIYVTAKFACNKWGMCEELLIDEEVADLFFQSLEKVRNIQNYHQNPYHNSCHAADVFHSFLFFCINGGIFSYISPLETMGCMVAALGHDVAHPALTNRFLVQNRDDMAINYNDQSVLENMHAHTTFRILARPGCNILEKFSSEDWFKIRKIIINLILDTDMSRHFEILGGFRARITNLSDFSLENGDNKVVVLSMALKCADVGHSAKIAELHQKWTALICEEFFRQGDLEKERKQEISMYCDRFNTDIPKSQAGFIKNICLPMYESWGSFIKSTTFDKECLDQIKTNLLHWVTKAKTSKNNEVIIEKGFEEKLNL